MDETMFARLRVHMEKKKVADIERVANKAIEESRRKSEEIKAEKTEKELAEIERLKKAEEKRQASISKVREKFKRKNEDLEDTDALAKLERQYERDLIELERLGATKEQKLELTKYYEGLIAKEEQKIIDDFEHMRLTETDDISG